jgi:hypothetical protein
MKYMWYTISIWWDKVCIRCLLERTKMKIALKIWRDMK